MCKPGTDKKRGIGKHTKLHTYKQTYVSTLIRHKNTRIIGIHTVAKWLQKCEGKVEKKENK